MSVNRYLKIFLISSFVPALRAPAFPTEFRFIYAIAHNQTKENRKKRGRIAPSSLFRHTASLFCLTALLPLALFSQELCAKLLCAERTQVRRRHIKDGLATGLSLRSEAMRRTRIGREYRTGELGVRVEL